MFSGTGLGGLTFPFIASAALEKYGRKVTLLGFVSTGVHCGDSHLGEAKLDDSYLASGSRIYRPPLCDDPLAQATDPGDAGGDGAEETGEFGLVVLARETVLVVVRGSAAARPRWIYSGYLHSM